MLVAKNIWKSYGTVEVLKGVDFELSAAEIVSIIGKSGSGKSTLLHILGTLDDFDQGSLLINDQEIHQLAEKKLATLRNDTLGFVFQFHHLLNEFSAVENVLLPALIKKTNQKNAENKAKELLDYLGLAHRFDHKPGQLSGGEQQRVAVARAMMNDPQIIFADEPTGNLDQEASEQLHQLFIKLRDDFNQAIVIVTHNLELAKLSDRVLNMQDGILSQK